MADLGWQEEEHADDASKGKNFCKLVWVGRLAKANFPEFKFEVARSEGNAVSLWFLALSLHHLLLMLSLFRLLPLMQPSHSLSPVPFARACFDCPSTFLVHLKTRSFLLRFFVPAARSVVVLVP